MSIAEVNGQCISSTDHEGSGPVVLVSHGVLMNGSMFEAQVEAGFRELLAVEGAGHASNVSHPAVVNEAMVRFLPSI
jgi:hypothetical protein